MKFRLNLVLSLVISFTVIACSQTQTPSSVQPSPSQINQTAQPASTSPALIPPAPQPAIPSTLALQEIHTWTRSLLLQRGSPALNGIISGLRVEGQEITRTDRHAKTNKANLFAAGLERTQTWVDLAEELNLEQQSEQISIYRHTDLDRPYALSFNEVNSPTIRFTREWMRYSAPEINDLTAQGFQVTFANFANNRLGGGWNTHGNVQEEQMAHMCSDFALILALFNPRRDIHQLHTRRPSPGVTSQEEAKYAGDNSASPLLLTHLRFLQRLVGDFERNSRLIYQNEWDMDQALENAPDAPAVNMIALAAPELRRPMERGTGYSLALIRDLFNNAYTAYKMVKTYDQLHSRRSFLNLGRWGAGAFGHNVNTVVAIQYLAARLVFDNHDEILFTGLTQPQSSPALQLVEQKIQQFFHSPGTPVQIDAVLQSIQADIVNYNHWFTQL